MWSNIYNAVLELGLMIGIAGLIAIVIRKVVDLRKWLKARADPGVSLTSFRYGYKHFNGPDVWKDHYPSANGLVQSPINIMRSQSSRCTWFQPLYWSLEYDLMPSSVRLYNDGSTVMVIPSYCGNVPAMRGGPIEEPHVLINIRFRWGGAEHTIDNNQYPLEMQALHVAYSAAPDHPSPERMLFISYVFQITERDNPFLQPIIKALKYVKTPRSLWSLELFPMEYLIPKFSSRYFYYKGSLTYPPCSEGVKWIIQPKPLTISARQVQKFRTVLSNDGPLLCNSRPLQESNDRLIVFYDH